MEQLTQYIEKFKNGLPELFETVITSYQDKINGDFADEYDIPEHEYVQSHPLVQLNEKLFEIKDDKLRYNFTFNNTVFFKNKNQSELNIVDKRDIVFIDIYRHSNSNNQIYFSNKVCYKYEKLLPKKEYVIAFIIDNNVFSEYGRCGIIDIQHFYYKSFSLIYITNYGRFIKVIRSTGCKVYNERDNCFVKNAENNEDKCIFIKNKKLYLQDINGKDKSGYPKLLTEPEINLTPLTYKFPKLFLDVIYAFRNESTDDMQKCCEKYNILLQKANNTSGYDKKIQSLEDENIKLKKEIELLKIQMEEQRKFYMT
jgi:hypothetical protein